MRFSIILPIAAAGSASLVAASQAHAGSAHNSGFELAKRHFDVSVHQNDRRTLCLLEGIIGGLLGGSTSCGSQYPSPTWKCSGSGLDGYQYDQYKNRCPSKYPAGWLWFGADKGWGPPKGWSVPSKTWVPPSDFGSKCSIFTWWAPSSTWQYSLSFPVPSFWLNLGWNSYLGPSQTWTCNKSGQDGWDYDYAGKGCPYNNGFKWFGNGIGWAPPLGWQVPSSTWIPLVDIKWSLISWWKPSTSWICPPTFTPPSWWPSKPSPPPAPSTTVAPAPSSTPAPPTHNPEWPSKDWNGRGDGNDGRDVDWEGKSCPYVGDKLFDSNGAFKWFGLKYGWQPEESWNIPYPDWKPPSGWTDVECTKATWWVPASSWKYPISWVVPSFWKSLDPSWKSVYDTSPTQPTWPAQDWVCDGSGYDGKDYDFEGKTCPYSADKLFDSNGKWKWFGVAKGWQPEESWNIPYPDWTPPSGWSDKECAKATWWVPASSWKYPISWVVPAFWKSLDPSWTSVYTPSPAPQPTFPSKDWQCSGNGDDGKEVDWQGNKCPLGLPFLWFGTNIGWAPAKGWRSDDNWTPYSGFASSCQKWTWWAPHSAWKYPVGFGFPSFWFKLGYFPYNWAPSSYVCNGSGTDGYSFDHLGNGLPSGFPSSGWFYFGIANQWQPHKDWKLPSSTWVPPSSWTPTRAPWWKPNTTWKVPSGYQCPSWWPVNLIQSVLGGILGWIF